MATVWYFWHGFIHRDTTFMYLQYTVVTLLIYHFLPNVCKELYTISISIFVDVPYWLLYSMDKFISYVVLVLDPSQWVVLSLWRRNQYCMDSYRVIRAYSEWFRISHCQRHKRSVTAAAVWLLAFSWKIMGFCITKCCHIIHAVPENILVPLQFWPRNIALVL